MMTVVDQHRPWLMAEQDIGEETQPQDGAKMMSNGTGSPTASQPPGRPCVRCGH